MIRSVQLNKTGYEPFLDFLKGVCIVFVILTHCISPAVHRYSLFCLWGDMAVPMFLLIQAFQTYKKGTNDISINFKKLLKRIIIPFFMAQLIGVAVLIMTSKQVCSLIFQVGNIGPGAYYPYIYLQFVLLLWLLAPVFNCIKNKFVLAGSFLVVSQIFEFL